MGGAWTLKLRGSHSARKTSEPLYKDLFGRGPTKAKTNFAGPDLLVSHFQYLNETEFVRTVEQITGRKVRAFVSGIDTKRDVSAELFYLEPRT